LFHQFSERPSLTQITGFHIFKGSGIVNITEYSNRFRGNSVGIKHEGILEKEGLLQNKP
jgi:hypothetical protein